MQRDMLGLDSSRVVILAVCLLAASAGPVFAAELEAGMDVISGFIWRGVELNQEPVLQMWGTVAAESGFSLTAWGNLDLTDGMGTGGDLTELDLVVAWTGGLSESLALEAGFIEYLYFEIGDPETGEVIADNERTNELYVALTLDGLLAPALTVYRDVGEVGGLYASLGVEHPVKLSDRAELELHAHLGAADSRHFSSNFGVDSSGLNDATVSASLRYSVSERLAVAVSAGTSWLLDGAVRESEGTSNHAWGGLHVTYAF